MKKQLAVLALMFAAMSSAYAANTTVANTNVDSDEALISEFTSPALQGADEIEANVARGRRVRRYVCYTANRRGQQFRGMDRFAREAQREANRKCRSVSRHCVEQGCQETFSRY